MLQENKLKAPEIDMTGINAIKRVKIYLEGAGIGAQDPNTAMENCT